MIFSFKKKSETKSTLQKNSHQIIFFVAKKNKKKKSSCHIN